MLPTAVSEDVIDGDARLVRIFGIDGFLKPLAGCGEGRETTVGEGVGVRSGDDERGTSAKVEDLSGVDDLSSVSSSSSSSPSASSELSPSSSYSGPLWWERIVPMPRVCDICFG